jgi:hypothetical protein
MPTVEQSDEFEGSICGTVLVSNSFVSDTKGVPAQIFFQTILVC